jgi:DNA-directed RNA polymerase subunit alpha
LSTRGKSEVTAADIDCPPDVEIINPELHLLTLDSSNSDLDIEFMVERGRGYSPAGERSGLPIAQIPVDAIFAPVWRASYRVDRTRIGQVTDHDRLTMEIWTDGTLRPGESLSTAAQILLRHVTPIAAFSEVQPDEMEQAEEEGPAISSKVYDTPIEVLELSMRAYNCLKRAGITKVGEVLEKLTRGQGKELMAIRNFGQKSFAELVTKLKEQGFLSEDVAEEISEAEAEAEVVDGESAAVEEVGIEELGLSTRVRNALNRAGIETVGQVMAKLAGGEGEELLDIRDFGPESLAGLLNSLRENGYLPPQEHEPEG